MARKNNCLTILILYISFVITNCIKIGGSVGGLEKNVVIKIKQPQVFTVLPLLPTTATSSVMTTTTTTAAPLSTVPKVSNIKATVETGIGCGTKLLKSGEVVMIQSNNFNVSSYPNNDACTWKFIGKECTVTAECPCVDIPPSFKCIEDYLKIVDAPFYHQKFCGSTQPNGAYRASTEMLSIRFRSDKSDTGKGFLCFVQCTAPGEPDQATPKQATFCPNFSVFSK